MTTAPVTKVLSRPREVVTVVYRASWKIVTSEGYTDSIEYAECSHDHTTPAAAEACARRHGAR